MENNKEAHHIHSLTFYSYSSLLNIESVLKLDNQYFKISVIRNIFVPFGAVNNWESLYFTIL